MELQTADSENMSQLAESTEYQQQISDAVSKLFDRFESEEFVPQDFQIDVPVDSLESAVGYSSLIRQMHEAFVVRVAYYRSNAGGSLSVEEARQRAFHTCTNKEEALKTFDTLLGLPLDNLNFVDLMELFNVSLG